MKKKLLLDTLLLFLLGVLSSFSLPPFNFFLINFFTFSIFFVFLFKKLNTKSDKKIYFFYGWFFGFGYFLTNIYWISISLTFDRDFSYLIPMSIILIPAFLALFYGLITLIFHLFNLRNLLSAFFLFSLLFGSIEFIRGNIFTGFPWNFIIYSLSDKLNFISIISVIGTYSLNLIVISLFSAPAIYILRKSKIDILVLIIFIFIPILFINYGNYYKQKFLNNEIIDNPYIIRVIGSNISLDRFYSNVQTENVINELIKLSAPNKTKKIFFLWPEGIIPDTYQDELNLYSYTFKENFNKNHLIGLGITKRLLSESGEIYFNSFSVFDFKLNLIEDYDKINLVPFGEFLPYENILNKIGLKTITNNFGSFTKGQTRKIIDIENKNKKLKILPLICYEMIYSGNLSKNFDFDLIFNISEDGWFGESIGPKQHFVHSVYRALESGKYVIRSANNGISAIINPLGQIEKKIDFGKEGFIDFDSRRVQYPTLFSLYGNKIFSLLILLYIFLIFSFNRFKNE